MTTRVDAFVSFFFRDFVLKPFLIYRLFPRAGFQHNRVRTLFVRYEQCEAIIRESYKRNARGRFHVAKLNVWADECIFNLLFDSVILFMSSLLIFENEFSYSILIGLL